jgi:hypothetical protein
MGPTSKPVMEGRLAFKMYITKLRPLIEVNKNIERVATVKNIYSHIWRY